MPDSIVWQLVNIAAREGKVAIPGVLNRVLQCCSRYSIRVVVAVALTNNIR